MNEQIKEYLPEIDILKISTDLQSELIRNLNTQTDLTDMMAKIVNKTHDLLKASACSVFTIDAPNRDRATQIAGTGYQAPYNGYHDVQVVQVSQVDESTEKGIRLGLTGWILSTGKPFLARTPEEIRNHPHFGRRKQIPGQEIWLQSFIGVPLRGLHGEVIGLIKAERRLSESGNRSINSFSVKDQLALETIARVASRCITYQSMAKEGQEIEAITAWARDVIAEAVATEGEMDIFLDMVVNVTAAAMRADSCGIFLKDESGNTLTQRAGIGSQALRRVIRAYQLPKEEVIRKCKDVHDCQPPTCSYRQINYRLNKEDLETLKRRNIFDETIIKHLEPLIEKQFREESELLQAIEQQIGLLTNNDKEVFLRITKDGVGLTAWIAATGNTFHASNFEELSSHCHHRGGYDGWNFPEQEQTECGAFLGVPLAIGGEIIGVVKVENKAKKGVPDLRDFPKTSQQCFEILAQDIALAIMRFQNQIPNRYRVIRDAQKTILEILRGGLPVKNLSNKVVTETKALFNAGACALFLKEGNRLIQPRWAASGWAAETGPEVREYELVEEVAIKENPTPSEKVGLTVWIAVKQKKFTARSNLELRMHPHHKGTFDLYHFQKGQQCESFMGFPLLIKEGNEDKLVGVLKVETKKKKVDEKPEEFQFTYFNELDELVFELIANSAAIAIQNARLMESSILADQVLNMANANAVLFALHRFVAGRVEVVNTLSSAAQIVHNKNQIRARIIQGFSRLLEPDFNIAILEQLSEHMEASLKSLLDFLAEAIKVKTLDQIRKLDPRVLPAAELLQQDFPLYECTTLLIDTLRQISDNLEKYEDDQTLRIALFENIEYLKDAEEKVKTINLFERSMLERVFAHWRKIIETAFEQFHHVRNPYIVGPPVSPYSPVFVGREEIFRWIHDSLYSQSQKNVLVLHGGWHTGKTSILKQLEAGPFGQRLRERRQNPIFPVFIDLQGIPDTGVDMFLLRISEKIHLTMRKREVDCPLAVETDFKSAHYRAFDLFLEKVDEILARYAQGLLVLMIDEFELLDDRVTTGKIDQEIFNYLRSKMQHQPSVTFILAGRHRLDEMTPNYKNLIFNVALHHEVGFLNREETERLIREPVKPSAVNYDNDVVERIWKLTRGHPYFIQQLCRNCVDSLNKERQGYQVTNIHLEKAIEDSLRHNVVLDELWKKKIGKNDRLLLNILAQLAENDQNIVYSELVHQSKLSEEVVSQSLQKLKTHQLIMEDFSSSLQQHQYRFGIDLLRLWVKLVAI